MVVKPVAPLPARKRAPAGAVPLTDQDDDSMWSGAVSIGEPAQNFVIDFDTGSADLWVPSSSCKDCGNAHNKYDASKSTQSKAHTGTFQISYGDGSTTSGTPYTDTGQCTCQQGYYRKMEVLTGLAFGL